MQQIQDNRRQAKLVVCSSRLLHVSLFSTSLMCVFTSRSIFDGRYKEWVASNAADVADKLGVNLGTLGPRDISAPQMSQVPSTLPLAGLFPLLLVLFHHELPCLTSAAARSSAEIGRVS